MDLSPIRANLDSNGKLKESVNEYRRQHNLCLYDGLHPATQPCPSVGRLS